MSIWYEQTGPQNDVVISSRVRFARNIFGYPNTHIAGKEKLESIFQYIKKTVEQMKPPGFKWVDLSEATSVDKYVFVEKHLMSIEMLNNTMPCALILNNDESLCVMINEEDHLRIQSILPGLQLETTYKMCNDFEEKLGEKVQYAFDEQLGYLTSCPTNIGTGLRVSAMMHLPGLAESGMMKKILEACAKMGVAIRGVYGENTEASGNIFQISNQVTLGHSEEEIIENILHIINQIMEKERNIRQKIFSENRVVLEDKVYRAYGVLANARSITGEEIMGYLSWVKLGVSMGIIDFINPVKVNSLMVLAQPGNIQKNLSVELESSERDEKRADLCRKMMEREVL